jgi:hypothetical protein
MAVDLKVDYATNLQRRVLYAVSGPQLQEMGCSFTFDCQLSAPLVEATWQVRAGWTAGAATEPCARGPQSSDRLSPSKHIYLSDTSCNGDAPATGSELLAPWIPKVWRWDTHISLEDHRILELQLVTAAGGLVHSETFATSVLTGAWQEFTWNVTTLNFDHACLSFNHVI